MTEQEYTDFTRSIDKEANLQTYALGLCEEAGEVAGKIKRIHRDDHAVLTDDRRTQILSELGDLLWYFTRIVDHLEATETYVRWLNYNKLTNRLAKGTLHGEGDNR